MLLCKNAADVALRESLHNAEHHLLCLVVAAKKCVKCKAYTMPLHVYVKQTWHSSNTLSTCKQMVKQHLLGPRTYSICHHPKQWHAGQYQQLML
jgi:hypothetical protein